MDRVYLVTFQQGDWDDYSWGIHCITSTKEKAQEKIDELKDRIQNIKTQYFLEFGRDYDTDIAKMFELDIEERHDQLYLYQARYEELKYHTIKIEEKQVI